MSTRRTQLDATQSKRAVPLPIALLLLLLHSTASCTAATLLGRDLVPDPQCTSGIQDGICCCSKECGTCGGESCQDHPGGKTACCCSAIANGGRMCNIVGPPCDMVPRPTPPPGKWCAFVSQGASIRRLVRCVQHANVNAGRISMQSSVQVS
jgi:hypothetical protein